MIHHWTDDENDDARIAFGSLDVRDRLAEALIDENGLRPTTAALDVLVLVAKSLNDVDELWSEQDFAGSPNVRAYAAMCESTLRHMRTTA